MNKHHQLFELAQKRKRSRWNGYNCIGDYHGGVYECDYVSPYTKSAYNLDSDIMVILKDWSSDEELSKQSDQLIQDVMKFGYTLSLPTNKKLIALLNANFGVGLNDIYATNLFPFIKPGKIDSKIHPSDLLRAAQEFALPQIKIVCPKLVVCLGPATFNAIRRVCGYRGWLKMDLAIKSPFKVDRSLIWCQAHPAVRPYNRTKEQVSSDWKRMKNAIFP